MLGRTIAHPHGGVLAGSARPTCSIVPRGLAQTRVCRLRQLPHPKSSSIASTAAAGGGGSTGGYSGGGGGGGGGDDSSSGGEGGSKPGGFYWKGWADRVAYDPDFTFKVFLEQVIGVGASVVGDMSSRPNWGLNELDFVFATLVVGSIVNFSLMYLLAPTAAAAATTGGSFLTRLLSAEILTSWGAPGGNMFQPGAFGVGQRLLNFGYKGVIFSSIGLAAGLIGTATSNGLLVLRKKLDPTFVIQNEPPSVLLNALTWSFHMGVSSNLRYQVLGGADQALVKIMPQALFRGYSAVIRATNNVLGGMSFVVLARLSGVQKAAKPVVVEEPLPVAADKKKKKKK